MRRRRFLAAAGASLVLAGCGSQDSTAGGDPGTDTPAADTGDFTLGETTDDANPHELRVTNGGDSARSITLRITDSERTETLLDRSFSLGVDGEISGELRGPATYEVRVTVSGSGAEHTATVEYFDTCNDYGTTVTIDASGSMTSQMYRTDARCPIPPTETQPPETTPPETPLLDGFALGETTGDVNPHGLTLRNDGDDSRTGRLRIADADTDETLLNRSFSLEAGETISGELRGPVTYEVRVTVSESGAEHTTAVEYFDTCNSYGTTVTIDADGAISSETLRTLIACDPETPLPDGFALGETTGDVNPHDLTVRNDGQDTRTVDLRITDSGTEETLLNRSFALGGEEGISGELRGPATYEVRVGIPEAGTEEVTTVEYFDTCNDYGTSVTVAPDATLTSEMRRTDAYCGTDSDGT